MYRPAFFRLLLTLTVLTITVPHAFGAPSLNLPDSGMSSPPHPWTTLHLPRSLQSRFQNTVAEVFEYGCPYCLHLNGTLRSWGRTLPKGYTFTQMPALIAPTYLDMTLATFAIEGYEPAKLGAFEKYSFLLVQGYHEPINKPAVYIAAAMKAGIPAKEFVQQVHSQKTDSLTRLDYILMRATLIHQTPTLVICGKYEINPSMVHGNYSVFLELANGLVSRCIRHQQH